MDISGLLTSFTRTPPANASEAEALITSYLRGSTGSAKADWLNYGANGNCPLGPMVDGSNCVALIEKCIGGDASGCVAEWKSLNFANGFDASTIDIGIARNLLNKLSITGTVDDWVKSKGPGFAIDPRVVSVLKVLVARTTNNSGTIVPSYASSGWPSKIARRPVFTLITGGGMVGGGRRNNAVANFVQMSDYLKNQYVLTGGSIAAPQTVAVLRQTLKDLEEALTKKGKAIDTTDKQRIIELFDSLQSTEDKAIRAAEYLSKLRRLVNHEKFDTLGVASSVSVQMMEELTRKHAELLRASERKSGQVTSILEAVARAADDIAAIKKSLGI